MSCQDSRKRASLHGQIQKALERTQGDGEKLEVAGIARLTRACRRRVKKGPAERDFASVRIAVHQSPECLCEVGQGGLRRKWAEIASARTPLGALSLSTLDHNFISALFMGDVQPDQIATRYGQ